MGVGEEGYTENGPWCCLIGSTRYFSYLEDCWPRVGGLSAVVVVVCCCFSHSAHWLPTRKKLLYTVANPARGLLNREKEKKKSGSAPPPPPPPPPPPRALLVRRKK